MFKETEVDECEIIVIGHLKWNPYFGEKKEDPPRGDPSTCTSVLVSGRQMDGKPFRMLIEEQDCILKTLHIVSVLMNILIIRLG